MRVQTLRVPGLVAVAAGTGTAAVLPAFWALPQERPSVIAVALVLAAYAATGLVILVARSGNRVGRTVVLGTAIWAVGELLLAWGVQGWARTDPPVAGAAHAAVLGTALRGAGWLVLVLGVPLTFVQSVGARAPGRLPRLLAALSISALVLGAMLAPYPLETRLTHLDSPTGLDLGWKWFADVLALAALGLAALTLALAVLGLRAAWRSADPLRRQQVLWFTMAFALPLLSLPVVATPWATPLLFVAVSAPTPVLLGIALLQRRLYDIELVMSRSLTYVLVSVAAVIVYAGTIATVGILLRSRGADWLPWVGAAVVAVLFAPLHVGVRSLANRVTYGHWSAPADVLAATERRLADATDLSGLVDALTAQLADLLRLPCLEVLDARGRVVSRGGADPPPGGAREQLRLNAYGEPAGTLRWGATSLRLSDRRLLEEVGHQLGEALHAAILTDQLQETRERLVLAREEERKRLRRDLHDGLGPSLAALGLEVDRLRNRVASLGPEQTDTELVRLRSGIQRTVVEVRRLVEGLRPPSLDELGLAGAIAHLARGLALDVAVDAGELPALPAATEVAAFRIAQEALTNVVHHAGASRVDVAVRAEGPVLTVEVRDDGRGRVEERVGGVGLSAMRERAAELGGTVQVVALPSVGTTVLARLPLPAAPPPSQASLTAADREVVQPALTAPTSATLATPSVPTP